MNKIVRSRLDDLKVISIIISITLALAGAAWGAVGVLSGKIDREESKADDRILHQRISGVQAEAEINKNDIDEVQRTTGRDVKTIKCLLTAPSRKAKSNCGLKD